jgi:hypothetical protein
MSLTAVCCFVACLPGCQAAPSVEAPLDVLHPNIGTLGSQNHPTTAFSYRQSPLFYGGEIWCCANLGQ